MTIAPTEPVAWRFSLHDAPGWQYSSVDPALHLHATEAVIEPLFSLAAAPVPSPHGNAWRPVSEHTAFGLNNSVIVAVPYDNKGERTYIVGEAYKIEPKGDAEPEWWWANTGPGDYTGDPIGSMGYGAPTLFQPLPVAPSEGVEP